MLFYVLLFCFCVLMFIISSLIENKKGKKIIAIITIIVLCFVSGTRYNIGGTDYAYYKSVYNIIPLKEFFYHLSSLSKTYGFEKGFLIYEFFIKYIGFNFYGFTLINSIIFYSLFFVILKDYDYNINFIIIMFLYKFFFYNTFVSIRQPLSILLFWYSLRFLKNKKYIYYYLLCFIALFFHKASIILFIIPFITNLNIKKKHFLILLIIGFIFFVAVKFNLLNLSTVITKLLSRIFSGDASALSKIESYGISSDGMSIFYTLEYYLIAIFVYLFYDKINKYDNYSSLFVKLFIIMLPLFTIFSNFAIVTRFKDYFFLCYPILIIYISKQIKKGSILVYLITIIISLYGFTRYIILFSNGCLMPYNSYINNQISIFRDE